MGLLQVPHAPITAVSGHQAFLRSLSIVSATELFDKTWCIGLLLAVKYRTALSAVFTGSFTALVLHTTLAAGFGSAIARLIAPHLLNFIAASLMLVFAAWSAWECYSADPDSDAIASGCATDRDEAVEPSDAESAVEDRAGAERSPDNGLDHAVDLSRANTALLQQATVNSPYGATEELSEKEGVPKPVVRERCAILAEAFCATFVAELGDRTQFVMVGQYVSQPLLPTFLGCSAAFFLATISAVVMGSMLASCRIKERLVHAVAACAFLVFSILSFREGMVAARASGSTATLIANLGPRIPG